MTTTELIEPEAQWSPAEPPQKKRHLGLWIGIPAAVVCAGVAAASLFLIAPGTSVAGVPVGLMTAGAATDAIQKHLAETNVTLGDSGTTLTGTELGATVDAKSLAADAFSQRPLWNVSQWFGEVTHADVALDSPTALAALKKAEPSLFTDPVDASVSFTGTSYKAVAAVPGTGVDVAALQSELQSAFDSGKTAITANIKEAKVPAAASTAKAEGAADALNGTLKKIGFYVGDDRVVPVDADVAADWLSVSSDAKGEFAITADAAKIQKAVDGLADKVNQSPVDGREFRNAAGRVLATDAPGRDGRTLGDTGGIAKSFANQLASGNGVYELPVKITKHDTTVITRELEVDLTSQKLYLKQNGATVQSWPISSGLPDTPTFTGRFTVNAHVRTQTMSSVKWGYSVPNVEWVMYFNGDQAFHGVYWHHDWGTPHSHGCVGMSNALAEQIYKWTADGTDVWIHK